MTAKKIVAGLVFTTVCAALSGCIESAQVRSGPVRATAVVVQPRPVVVPVAVAEPVYVAAPHDVYISAALDSDVVYVGGFTYIWYVGQDGRRYRHLYGRGDLRGQVFHRRDELHVVMAHHGGHLPPPPTGLHTPLEMAHRARPAVTEHSAHAAPPARGTHVLQVRPLHEAKEAASDQRRWHPGS
ncbi:hypothetical protein [Paraburkholderia youngii]|uniref:hypothetical protein n=1 Tax=Paraburkholderia youngii TaxID=2782701 RepID=UPI003D1990F1